MPISLSFARQQFARHARPNFGRVLTTCVICLLALTLQIRIASAQTNTPIVTSAVTAGNGFASGCPSLPAPKSSFLTTDSQVWLAFYYLGGNAGDTFSVEWFEPNGGLYLTNTFSQTASGGSYCYSYFIAIAGYPPAGLPGEWTVKLVRNNSTQMAAFSFEIASPQSTAPVVTSGLTSGSGFAPGCPSLPSAKSSFLSTDSQVWLDLYYTGGNANDTFSIEWFEPSGALYITNTFKQSVSGGSYCPQYFIGIAGYPPASMTGEWTVKFVWNSTQLAAFSFTISAPPATVSYSNSVMTTQAPSTSGCIVPPAVTAFSTNNVVAYLYFEATITNSDNISSSFLAPDGSIVAPVTYGSAAGNFCFPAGVLSLTNLPSSQLGSWQARVYDNGALVFNLPFTVSAPAGSTTITYANQVMTKQAPPSSGCVRPPASASFLTSDTTAYLYFEAQVTVSDNLTTSFLAPDGTVVPSVGYIPGSGDFCYDLGNLAISSLSGSQLGSWQARVYDNGVLVFSVPFTVSASGSGSAPDVTTLSLPNGTVGQPYGPVTMMATGGSNRYTWSVSGAPPGVTITPAGVLSSGGASLGPAAAGIFSVTVTATDSTSGLTGSRTYPVTVVPATLSSMTVSASSVSISVASTCQNNGTSCTYALQQVTPSQIQVTSNGSPINFSFAGLVFSSTGSRLPSWLNLSSPSMGILSVSANATLLGQEDGRAFISISGQGVSNSPQVIVVSYSFTCTGSCRPGRNALDGFGNDISGLSVSPSMISFPQTGSASSALQTTFGIVNNTSASASGSTISVQYSNPNATGWLLTPTTGPSNGPVSVGAQPTGLAPGLYQSTVTVQLTGCGSIPCPSGPGTLNVQLLVQLSISTLSPGSVNAGTGSFPLTVIGTGLVSGSVVEWNGTSLSTTYSNGQLIATVPANLIASSGSATVEVVNTDGTTSNTLPFTIGAAGPSISGLNPSSIPAGSAQFQLAVTGANFVSGSTVNWNGGPLTTSFQSTTLLNATVPASLVANQASVSITVANPGGALSGATTFTVTPPAAVAPTITSLNPPSATTKSPSVTVTITGTGFVSGATAQWNGLSLSTSFGSATSLTAVIPAGDLLTPGTGEVTVQNPNGLSSNSFPFPVNSTSALQFQTLTPCRVLDTRLPPTSPFAANTTFGSPYIAAGTVRNIPIPQSSCGVPASALAYSLNFTVQPRTSNAGYLTVWPTNTPQPNVSTVSFSNPAVVLAAAGILGSGTNGSINATATQDIDLIVDINGYFVPPGANTLQFYPLPPCRVLDTRTPANGGTFAANSTFGSPGLDGVHARSFPIPSSPNNCGAPANASAYSFNVTVYPSPQEAVYFVAAYPTGGALPNVSTLNSFTGTLVANAAIVPAAPGGMVNFYASNPTDFFVDINGYFAAPGINGLNFYTVNPCRLVDTRGAAGTLGGPTMTADSTRSFPLPQSPCGIPGAPSVQAYSLGITVHPPPGAGLYYLTTWPYGQAQPFVSTLNDPFPGVAIANAALVPAGTGGSINVFVTNPTDVTIDTAGYFGP